MKPLTAEEIADLTPSEGESALPDRRGESINGYVMLDVASYDRIRNALPRLLDEVEQWRKLAVTAAEDVLVRGTAPAGPPPRGLLPSRASRRKKSGTSPADV